MKAKWSALLPTNEMVYSFSMCCWTEFKPRPLCFVSSKGKRNALPENSEVMYSYLKSASDQKGRATINQLLAIVRRELRKET